MKQDTDLLSQAIALAYANIRQGGRPFGALVVKDGEIIAQGVNEVVQTNDPTAHAELMAIRAASKQLGSASLAGCSVFASGHPCPMCMGAMRLAGVKAVTYAYSNEDGDPFGLSTAEIYADLAKPLSQQSMTIRHVPTRLAGQPDLYAHWKHHQ
ncbi:nucleoside deaminase [Pusillimonas sp. SM2304]|uniref:nucleoside deaminase n=1 Tax=Pusillimonas sp. SM2304 TaxID=3073241 RepID=UPI002874EA5A|nr:nucleoside deaminase [Pusillimonas sp. SM2304]MDS1141195.1 nucleoside deaminase [Pusillimonas sp. SM2304]